MVRKINGFSLTELIVVIAILSIVLVIAIPMFSKWRTRYYIESDIKNIYSLLEEGRVKAFTYKKDLTLVVNGKKACLKENSNNIKCIQLKNPFTGSISISRRGTFNKTSIVYAGSSGIKPAYDCISVTYTRARLGVYDGTSCRAK